MTKRTSFTRREFVKGAAGAAAAAAFGFPTIVPSSVFGTPGAPAPSGRLNLGFIGIGKQSTGHLDRYIGRTDTIVRAVCDVHKGRMETAKSRVETKYAELSRQGFKGCDAFLDYRELLARKDIDAVVIGTPDHWHTAQAIDACKAKKDVYCEKPLTLTIHEAKTLIDCVRKHERVLQTGSQQRSEPEYFRQAAEYVRNGRLGKIKEVLVAIGTTSKPCDLPAEPTDPNVNWDVWLGQAPQRPYNEILCRKSAYPNGSKDDPKLQYPFNPGWRDYREYSGGHVTDWGAHHFDITQWALDMDQSGPVEIRPPEKEGDKYGARLIYRGSPVGGDEIVVAHVPMAFEHVVTDKDGNKKPTKESNGILFIGDKGKLFVNRGRIVSEPGDILKQPIGDGDKRLFKSPGHHENWLQCIQSRERPVADVEVGARSVTVCHLMNLAYWNKRNLKWDPQKWEFPGDAEANGWRTREQRDPYKLPTF